MNSFLAQYTKTRDIFNDYLSTFLDEFECTNKLNESMKYSLNAGGKRLRPVLMIETGYLFDLPADKVMPLALSIEMIHTYSLIHDDLPAMDNDTLRRGKPTNHVVYGEDNAILAGDGLLNLAMETAVNNFDITNAENNIAAIKELFAASGASGMVGGQSVDINSQGKFADIDELKHMHSLKTGALFRACCICPAYLSGADEGYINALQNYSQDFGLLFQITDDILDATGSQEKLGKTPGKDKENNKSTYVNIFGLDKSKNFAKEISQNAKNALNVFDKSAEFHIGLIDYVLERDS